MDWLYIFFVLALVVFSGVFSAAETALTAVSRGRIYRLSKEGNPQAHMVKMLLASMEQLIGTILLGYNFVSILATSIATSILIKMFGDQGIGIATILMTLLLLIFSEVMPKVYAFQNAEKVSLKLAPLIHFIYKMILPFSKGIKSLVRRTWKLFGIIISPETSIRSAKEEILSVIEMYSDHQIQKEKGMLRGILDLETVDVSDVMVHRKDLTMINGDLTLQELRSTLIKTPYTRFPVWEESPDNIIGILHLRSFAKAILEDPSSKAPVKSLLHKEPWFVPESTSLLVQLQEFRKRREHMALVIDEYGALEGMVTLEDILEEIVGEISDEYDEDQNLIRHQKDGSYLIAGAVTLRDLNRHFDWSLPDHVAATLAGLVLHECQGLPQEGETYFFHNLYITVTERHHNQLAWFKVVPKPIPKPLLI